MDHRPPALAALFVVAGCATAVMAQDQSSRPDDITVSCESREGQRTSCPANLEGYRFSDIRQQSSAPCEPGRSWGYTERGVWVAEGCRADFLFSRDGRGGGYAGRASDERDRSPSSSAGDFRSSPRDAVLEDERVVTCESEDGRREECPADLRGMRFADLRQSSRTTCELGRNFGYNDRGVWVEEGCRAEFLFRASGSRDEYARSRTGGDWRQGTDRRDARGALVSCESVDEGYSHCDAPGIVSARVANQLSRSECVQGTSWGIDPRGIWVDRGCRAEFEVFTRLSDSPTRPTRW